MSRRALQCLVFAAATVFTGSPRADSEEYSALVHLESELVGLQTTGRITARSPLGGSAVLVIAGLSTGAFDLGSTYPILRVGPPFFFIGGNIASDDGKFEAPYVFDDNIPSGLTIYAQAWLLTVSSKVIGSNAMHLVPNGTPASWADASAGLPAATGDFAGADVDWGDLDRDGRLDAIVATNGVGAHPMVLVNQDGANFTEESATRFPAAALKNTICVEIADVNLDGYDDIFLSTAFDTESPAPNLLMFNDGTGHFLIDPTFPEGVGMAVDAEFGDLDGDGDLDLAAVSTEDPDYTAGIEDPVVLYIQNAQGQFVEDLAFTNLPLNDPVGRDGDVSLGDLDDDGDLDIFVAKTGVEGAGAQNRVYFNDGTGTFTDETLTSLPQEDDSSYEAGILDIDKDGALDLFVANSVASQVGVSLLKNVGPSFQGGPSEFIDASILLPRVFPPFTDIRLNCDVIDVDGDGDEDIAVGVHHLFDGGAPAGETFLLLNQGGHQGGVLSHYEVDAAFGPFGASFIVGDVSFADIDNDGDPDCYISNSGDVFGIGSMADKLLVNGL